MITHFPHSTSFVFMNFYLHIQTDWVHYKPEKSDRLKEKKLMQDRLKFVYQKTTESVILQDIFSWEGDTIYYYELAYLI